MRERLEGLEAAWREASAERPVVRRLEPWAHGLIAAARESLACRLDRQAGILLDRVQMRLDALLAMPGHDDGEIRLAAVWDSTGLPKPVGSDRSARVWRRVRALRAARLPFQGEYHPAARGLAWGPYNQQSAVAETLQAAARVDALWVDDFLEREKAMRALDELLGFKP